MTTSSLPPPGERVLPARPGWPDATGHFGIFGGRFVPEALIAALDELTEAYEAMRVDPAFLAEFDRLQRDYTGRPSPVTEVPRFAEHAGGARILLKREDLNHTGSHKINNVLGQALLAKRMGKTRVIAETGAGQHGVATATAAALMGLACTVYMGEEDTRRQALNVVRMRLLGAEVVPVTTGSRTLKDAINEALRDWVTNVETTHYVFGTVAGPHPFPAMVRDFQRVIGDEARAQVLERGGPAARRRGRLRRRRLQRDRHLHRLRPRRGRAAGRLRGRRRRRRHRPARGDDHRRRRRACCTAPAPTCCRTRTGRPSSRTRSPPAWTTPASARSTPTCTTSAAPSTAPVTDAEAMEAFALLCRTEGIIPAIESAHALAGRDGARQGARAATTRCCWSTCPAAATRTSRPPSTWFGLGDREEVDPGPGLDTDQQPTEGAVSNDEAVGRPGRGGRTAREPWPSARVVSSRGARRRPRAGPR